jgi:plasmid stabilization system protein ParE
VPAGVSGYILSVDADLDLDDIWEYIAADTVDAAD